jgi:TPR repeat protein
LKLFGGRFLRCRVCARLWARHDEMSDAWERAHSNDSELWAEQEAYISGLIDRAWAIREADPGAAFRLYLEAAESGSASALESIGWHYWTGTVVDADPDQALEYYRRAISAGSWMATLSYARLLAELGDDEASDEVLEEGVAADFVPAFYWLARLRYTRSRSPARCREIAPLLEYAADQGHPAARIFLAQLSLRGRFGLRRIAAGLRMSFRCAADAADAFTR